MGYSWRQGSRISFVAVADLRVTYACVCMVIATGAGEPRDRRSSSGGSDRQIGREEAERLSDGDDGDEDEEEEGAGPRAWCELSEDPFEHTGPSAFSRHSFASSPTAEPCLPARPPTDLAEAEAQYAAAIASLKHLGKEETPEDGDSGAVFEQRVRAAARDPEAFQPGRLRACAHLWKRYFQL